MKKYSIEILPKQKDKIPKINNDYFEDVYVTHIPGSPPSDLIEASKDVLNNNLNPVPHIPARSMESESELSGLLSDLNNIGVKSILMIGGSSKEVLGPYSSTSEIIQFFLPYRDASLFDLFFDFLGIFFNFFFIKFIENSL